MAENETSNLVLNHYTIKLGVSEINQKNKSFTTVDIGTHEIITGKGYNNVQLIALLKRKYPELTKYRNVAVLQKDRKNVTIKINLDKLHKHIDKVRQ